MRQVNYLRYRAFTSRQCDELPAALQGEGKEVVAAVAGELGFVRLAFGELTDDVSEVEGVLIFLLWLCFAVPCLRRR